MRTEDLREKMAFQHGWARRLRKLMPFGVTYALATFENLMKDVIRPYLDMFRHVYFDDITDQPRHGGTLNPHAGGANHTKRRRTLRRIAKCDFWSVQSGEPGPCSERWHHPHAS